MFARIRNHNTQEKIWTEEEGFVSLPNILFEVCNSEIDGENEGLICIRHKGKLLTVQSIDFEVGETK